MKINIDDIIFVLNPSPPKLLPCKVIEQIISRRVDGEQVRHTIEFQTGKTYQLEKIKKPWFTSIDQAKKYLSEEANRLVNSVIDDGISQAEKHFGLSLTQEDPPGVPSLAPALEPEQSFESDKSQDLIVDLGDGTKARVNINLPEELK